MNIQYDLFSSFDNLRNASVVKMLLNVAHFRLLNEFDDRSLTMQRLHASQISNSVQFSFVDKFVSTIFGIHFNASCESLMKVLNFS